MQQASLDNTIILILPYSFTTDQHNIQHNENNTEKWTHFKWWEHNVIVNSWFFFQKSFCSHTYEQLKTWWGQGPDCSASLYPNSTHLTECNNVACMIHMIYEEFLQFSYSTSVIWNLPLKNFTGPILKSTSPGLSETTFSARCTNTSLPCRHK